MVNENAVSRRQLIQYGGLVALTLGLASCADSGTGGGASGGTVKVADPSYLKLSYQRGMDAVSAAFKSKNAGWKVQQVAPPSAQYASTVLTQLQAGSPPDVIRIDDPQMTTYVDRGWLLPVDDVVSGAGLSIDKMMPSQMDAHIGGKTYGIVKESNPRTYIYNQALYRKHGVEVPTDVASFEQVIRKTTDASEGNFGIGFATKEGDPTTLFIQLMPFVLGFGGAFFTDAKPSATSDKTVESLEFAKMLWKDNLVPRGLDATSVNNLLAQGKVATMLSGGFIIGLANASNPAVGAELTTAVNPLPSGITMRATAWWGVPSAAKNPEAGKAYLKALLEPDVQRAFQSDTAVLVATRDGVSPEFVEKFPWFKNIVEAGFSGSSVSYFPQDIGTKASKALPIIGDAILRIFYNDEDVNKAMKGVQSELEAL